MTGEALRVAVSASASVLALVSSSVAFAAEPDVPVPSRSVAQVPPGAVPEAGLQDIVVTARRQSESLQRAAIPLSVISSDSLARAGVTTPQQLSALAPSLTAANTGGTGMSFFVRGVGNFTLSPTFDSAVAFNYDNVYISRPNATGGFFYDLERVEVLKGPQGTLYGRNATAGAINLIPVKPKYGELSGFVNGTYGNYDTIRLEGALNLPVGENGALRISANRSKHDGYLSDGASAENTTAVRVQLAGELTPNLSARMSADYAGMRGNLTGGSYVGGFVYNSQTSSYTTVPFPLPLSVGAFDPRAQAFIQQFFVLPSARLLGPLPGQPENHNDYFGANAEIKWETGAGTLTVIPSWRYDKQNQTFGGNGFVSQNKVTDEQYALEARFQGKRIGVFDYTLGALYFHEANTQQFAIARQTVATFQRYKPKSESVAGFAQVTAHLTDRLRVVGGLRYTWDHKSNSAESENIFVICTTFPSVPCLNAPNLPIAFTPEQLGYALPPKGPGGAVPIAPNVILSRSPLAVVDDSFGKGRATFRAAVEYDLAPRSLLYASVETGYRVGGLQPTPGFEIYGPEKITAYTVGSKNRFFGNRIQLNVEGFLWKYRDQQLAALAFDATGIPNFFIRNIGRTTNYGVDADAQFAVTPTTLLSAQVLYVHSKYDSFKYSVPGAPQPAPFVGCGFTPGIQGGLAVYNVDCSGKSAFNAPRWTVTLGAEQRIPVGDYEVVISGDTQYRSSRWVGFDYSPGELQGATWQSGAQLLFQPKSGQWSIAAFVHNIENERFLVNVTNNTFGGLIAGIPSPPRTYGIRAGVKF